MRKQKGFSLIELLIVIAIILIIAAIAVPNLLRSKMAANEASAVGTVRTINNAQVLYSTTYPDTGYTTLAQLGGAAPCTPGPATACMVDPVVSGGGSKSGYLFVAAGDGSGPPAVGFTVNGDPVTFGTTGARNFFSDQTFVIRYSTNGKPAAATDKPLQ
jgi:type IV pilus assembly protein PilA